MRRHQIITVGRDFDTIYLGIKEFRPQFVHLLVTKESKLLCAPLLLLLSDRVKVSQDLVGPYDMDGIVSVCERILAENPEDEFIFNLSEGTKIMALAAGKAAREHGCRAIYITQDGYLIDTPDYVRRPLRSAISNEDYLRLYGGCVRTFEDVSELKSLDVNAAYYVKKFIERHYDIYRMAKGWFRSLTLPKSGDYFFKGRLANGAEIETRSGTLSIYRGFEVFFDSASGRCCELMFLGRWWEVVVADVVSDWHMANVGSCGKDDIWHDVIFNEQGGNAVKNEIDLVVNDRQRLLLIECKSGEITSADIFKIDSVRRTYGGNNSKALLISYLPVASSLLEKCKDLGIYCFAPEDMAARTWHVKSLPQWLDTVVQMHEL